MTQFRIVLVLTLVSVGGLVSLGLRGGVPAAAPLDAADLTDRTVAASVAKVCGDTEMNRVYQRLYRRNRLASALEKNQAERLMDVEEIYREVHRHRALSEGAFFISTTAILVPTSFKAGAVYGSKIWGGLSLMNLIRIAGERAIVGERPKIKFDQSRDPLGPANVFTVADVNLRIAARFAYFEEQHRELTEQLEKALARYPDGFWGQIRESLTLGADADEYAALLLAEAKYRHGLYAFEADYTGRVMLGIRNVCRLKSGRLVNSELIHLVPLL